MTPFKYQISYFLLFWQKNWVFTTVVELRMLQPSTNSYQTISIHEWIQVVELFFNFKLLFSMSIVSISPWNLRFWTILMISFSAAWKWLLLLSVEWSVDLTFDSTLYLYCNTIPTIRFILFQFGILFSSLNSISSFNEVTHTCASFFTSGFSADNLPFDLSIFQVEADLHKKDDPSDHVLTALILLGSTPLEL